MMIELCDFGVGSFSRKETGTAIDRTSLGWVKRDSSLLSALCALHRYLDALSHSRRLRRGDSSQAFVLRLFAGLATLGFVLEALVVKEYLLACSPDEVLVAVDAPDGAVLKLGFLGSFHYLNGFRVCHDLLPSGP